MYKCRYLQCYSEKGNGSGWGNCHGLIIMPVTKCCAYIGYIGCLGHRHCRNKIYQVVHQQINLELKHIAGSDTGFEGGGAWVKNSPSLASCQ